MRYPAENEAIHVGQLVLWRASDILDAHIADVHTAFEGLDPWYINIISLADSKSYFYTDDTAVRAWLIATLGVSFDGNLAIADRMWLRKEIMQQAITKGQHEDN